MLSNCRSGTCVLAVDESGEIVGMLLGGVKTKVDNHLYCYAVVFKAGSDSLIQNSSFYLRVPNLSSKIDFIFDASKIISTLLGGSSFARFCQQEFGEFPRLVGRYCSYLLPKQTGGTTQILIFKTLRMIDRPAL